MIGGAKQKLFTIKIVVMHEWTQKILIFNRWLKWSKWTSN